MLYEGTLAAARGRGIGANIVRKIKFTKSSNPFIISCFHLVDFSR